MAAGSYSRLPVPNRPSLPNALSRLCRNVLAATSRCAASRSSSVRVGRRSSRDKSTPIRPSIRRCIAAATRGSPPFRMNRTDSHDANHGPNSDGWNLSREIHDRFLAWLKARADVESLPLPSSCLLRPRVSSSNESRTLLAIRLSSLINYPWWSGHSIGIRIRGSRRDPIAPSALFNAQSIRRQRSSCLPIPPVPAAAG